MRLAAIAKEFGDQVAIEWKSFLLRPEPRQVSLERFRRYTESWRRPAEQPGGGRFRVWSTDEGPPSHSVPPNVAVKAAGRLGRLEDYHLALMDAYFYANRNVTDRGTIMDVARECGLDTGAFERLLDDPDLVGEVQADFREAMDRGITGVPTVVVDGELAVPGAQDLDFYRHLVRRRLEMKRDARG